MGSTAPRHVHSFREYLAIEDASPIKHEFFAGAIYAMAGGTPEHAALCAALIYQLVSKLRGGPGRAYTSDLRLRVLATGLATYPDVAVVCGDLVRDPESPSHVTNPRAIFEVLSPGTETYDREEKREQYEQIDTLRVYVLVAQGARRIELWAREPAGWIHRVFGSGEEVPLDAIGCSLSVDELYSEAGAV